MAHLCVLLDCFDYCLLRHSILEFTAKLLDSQSFAHGNFKVPKSMYPPNWVSRFSDYIMSPVSLGIRTHKSPYILEFLFHPFTLKLYLLSSNSKEAPTRCAPVLASLCLYVHALSAGIRPQRA